MIFVDMLGVDEKTRVLKIFVPRKEEDVGLGLFVLGGLILDAVLVQALAAAAAGRVHLFDLGLRFGGSAPHQRFSATARPKIFTRMIDSERQL
jgi:hypothetical protein